MRRAATAGADGVETPGASATQISRRDRLRRELTDEIVRIGREQLAAGGPAGVSWRGIAKQVGMSPASLYTYVDGIDDLFTRILLAAFGDLAAHLEAAAASEPEDAEARLIACCLAYRAWAVANPQQFNLIFTDQIPGYAAPPGGPTVEAEVAVFAPLVAALGELIGRELDPLGLGALPLAERTRLFAPFAAVHGFVMLEINHHAPVVSDDASMLSEYLRGAIASLRPR
jgi:AcrR family transcriptional regulator